MSAGIIFSYISPGFANMGDIQSETEEYQRAIDNAAAANQEAINKINQIDSVTTEERYRLELALSDEIDPVRYAYELESLILSQGLFLSSISIGEKKPLKTNVQGNLSQASAQSSTDESGLETSFSETDSESGFSQIVTQTFDFTVSGTYEQLQDLIQAIEQNARLTDFMEVEFSATDEGAMELTATVRTYGLK